MAGTLTKRVATPYALKYQYSGVDLDTASKTAAQLIADCAAGPLKTFLGQINAGLNGGVSGQVWTDLGLYSPALSVYITPETTSGGGGQVFSVTALFNSGPNRFDVVSLAVAGTLSAAIEIRFHPTAVR